MAILRKRGYEYRGFRLGDKVKYRGNEYEIIGFDENGSKQFIVINDKYHNMHVSKFKDVTSYCDTNYHGCRWLFANEIEIIKKYINESVLELDYQQIFDQIGIRISYQNFEIIPRGKFTDDDLGIYSNLSPSYSPLKKELHVLGDFSMNDNKIIIVPKEDVEIIKNKVEFLNKKYKKTTVESKKDLIDNLTEKEAKEMLYKIREMLVNASKEE